MSGLRIRRVVVAGELVEQLLQSGCKLPTQILEGLPAGARFVSAGTMQGDRRVVLIFEHDSFEPWEPGSGEPSPEQPIVVGSVEGPLRVLPGDVLVVRYPHPISSTQRSGVREQLQQVLEHHFGFKVRALVLDDGAASARCCAL